MLKTKSVYEPESEEDGLRVLVTRYWPRGVKKEACGRWVRHLGPEPELIRLWKSEKIKWQEFKRRYLAEFNSVDKTAVLNELKEVVKAAKGHVTLLCACSDEAHCHRILLKGLLEKKTTRK